MNEPFARAFLRKEFEAFGFRLNPYSLAHSFALEMCGCGIEAGGTVTVGDAYMLALFASRQPVELRDAATLESIRAVAPDFTRFDMQASVSAVEEYLAHYRTHPRRWNGRASSPRAPWQWVAVARLCATGVSIADAWAMPVSEATALLGAQDAYNGDDGIMSDAERAIIGDA